MGSPEISSTNRALTLTIFAHQSSRLVPFSGYMGTDLFKNLNLQSLEFIMPSN